MQNIFVTGSSGYIGRQFIEKLHYNKELFGEIIAMDIRIPDENAQLEGIRYVEADIRADNIGRLLQEYKIDTIVHLAAIISITGHNSAAFEYDVDVNGSKNLIDSAVASGVKLFIHSSSGAAYGYWPSNMELVLTEDMAMRGNEDIPYSLHKYLVEEYLHKTAKEYPNMEQFIFRVGTILGETTKNPITDYLSKEKLLCIKGYPSAFVAIWDKDLVEILYKATQDGKPGIYNVAGDGTIPTQELAQLLNKPAQVLPLWLLKLAFAVLRPLRLIPYGPESLKFIQYRPVLSNEKLKNEFAYTPQKSTKEVFEFWKKHNLDIRRKI